jgi:hypothetical protein
MQRSRFVEFRGLSSSLSLLDVGSDYVTFTNCTWFGNGGSTLFKVDYAKLTQFESCSFIENQVRVLEENSTSPPHVFLLTEKMGIMLLFVQHERVLHITRSTVSVRFNTFSRNQVGSFGVISIASLTAESNTFVTIVGNSFVNNSGRVGSLWADLLVGSVLTMTNNVVSGNSGSIGATLQIRAQSSSVSLIGNTFTDNTGSTHGAIELQGYDQSVLEIRTSTFTNNRGQNGAGAVSLRLFSLSSALLSDNTFLNNTGTQTGAILVNNGTTTMIRNVFQTNSAVNGNGGAIYGTGGGMSVIDSKFLFNSAKTGGAVYMSNTTSPSSINKCEFLCNTASDVGGAMYFSESAQGVVIENSLFRSNSAAKQGGALHLNLNNQVNIVRNNSFESNWSQSFGGAMYCTSFGETPTLAILENAFTYNVAGGAANTTTFGAAYYTTTCRCANDTSGSSTFTNSSQIIAIEEGEVDPSCPTVSSSPPLFEAGFIHPELACYPEPPIVPEEPVAEPTLEPTVAPLTSPAYEPANELANEPLDAPVVEQPTEEPKEPPAALGIVDPPPGGVDLSVGAIVGIVVGIILLLLLLLLLIMLLLFYRRRRRSAQTKNGEDAGASPTTTTTAASMSATVVPLVTEESASSESAGESNSSLPGTGEDDVAPLAVAMAPVPVVASAAVQKRIREVWLFFRKGRWLSKFPDLFVGLFVCCLCVVASCFSLAMRIQTFEFFAVLSQSLMIPASLLKQSILSWES